MLNPDYAEILSLFREHEVDYLLVGAYALAIHGFPRATADIDLFVRPAPDNAEKVVRALSVFGAPLQGTSVDDFSVPGIVLQIGVAPRRIDILTTIDGLTYEEASRDRVWVEIGELSVPVISKANLIRNKRATGRKRDLLDADALENT